jgi:glycyl-tRNA synthetase alpha subunit
MKTIQKARLAIRLWRRARYLQQELQRTLGQHQQYEQRLAQSHHRIAELEAELARLKSVHEEEGRRLREQLLEYSSRAAAKHYDAYKWAHDYKVMELHLAAATSERDSYLRRMRELTGEVQNLQTELARQRNGGTFNLLWRRTHDEPARRNEP